MKSAFITLWLTQILLDSYRVVRQVNLFSFIWNFVNNTYLYFFYFYLSNKQLSHFCLIFFFSKTLMECLKARKVLTEPEVRYWLYQIVSAVEYMHNKLVIHRDLKLANVFISKMRAKVGDFGLCTQLTEKNQKKMYLLFKTKKKLISYLIYNIFLEIFNIFKLMLLIFKT